MQCYTPESLDSSTASVAPQRFAKQQQSEIYKTLLLSPLLLRTPISSETIKNLNFTLLLLGKATNSRGDLGIIHGKADPKTIQPTEEE